MNANYVLLLFLLAPLALRAGIQEIKPTVKTQTSFAIVVDRASYEKTRPALEAYRDAVERDKLAAWILVTDGNTPEAIREKIIGLHRGTMPLEGVVFVGDIPIPMLRDAQHLSSAFKMDQNRDWKESSIPSDRYYDDFDLRFDFIRRDSVQPLYFYYTLNPRSVQHIDSEIYSARIKAPERPGQDKYVLLDKFLRKVVEQKSRPNPVDSVFVFRGHGYNSDDPNAWADEQRALQEQFPSLFLPGGRVRFTDHYVHSPLKEYLLEEIQRPGTDIVLGHHHGAHNIQYINDGSDKNSGTSNLVRQIQRNLRSSLNRSKDTVKTKAEQLAKWGIPERWLVRTDSLRIADSLYSQAKDIYTDDIYRCRPATRFILHDACDNGSFHREDYVAGAYLFSDGRTVAAQGCTVNSLQDKWPNEFMGLFAAGIRLGQWSRQVQYLETHLMGDPTYRFANTVDPSLEINNAIVVQADNNRLWRKLADHRSPDIQTMALRRLSDNGYPGIASLLRERMAGSPFGIVRMEALQLLKRAGDAEFREAIVLGVNDNYELIRRFSTKYIGECGDDHLIPHLVQGMQEELLALRSSFYYEDALTLTDPVRMKAEIERQFANKQQLCPASYPRMEELLEKIDRYDGYATKEGIEAIEDRMASESKRRREISTLRNNPYHRHVPRYVAFAEDTTQPESLRINMIEALGWFTQSYQRSLILGLCDKLIASGGSDAIVNEAIRTKARLTGK